MKYNLLHILFWITNLSIYGYIAIFLQYKGLTNTEIGLVSGTGALCSIFISPFISSLITKIKGLTIKKMILILYLLMIFIFNSYKSFALLFYISSFYRQFTILCVYNNI